MNDLSMHLLDIIQNSISAGADLIKIRIVEDIDADFLSMSVEDNGKGMTEEEVARLTDPFFTSRTTRKVGMGIPLLLQSARQSGGDLYINSQVGVGTVVKATFGYSNIDRPPLGDFVNAVMLMIAANPALDFILNYLYKEDEYEFKTSDVKEIFGKEALQNISFIRQLEQIVKDNIAKML